MKLPAVLASLTIVLLPTIATAAPATPLPENADLRDPSTATLAAVIPTLVGGALVGGGLAMDDGPGRSTLLLGGLGVLAVGPSLGHFYAGAHGRGLATMGIRVGGMATVAGAVWLAEHSNGSDNEAVLVLEGMALTAGIVVIGQAIVATIGFDIFDAEPSVRRHNRDLQLMPTALPAVDGAAAGLAIGGSF